jgi:hypothetical protein
MLTTLLDLKWRRTKLLPDWFVDNAKSVIIRNVFPRKELLVRLS